jgi:hypothetical protein
VARFWHLCDSQIKNAVLHRSATCSSASSPRANAAICKSSRMCDPRLDGACFARSVASTSWRPTANSGARLCATAMLLSGLRDGTLEAASTKRISLVFARLWEESGCRKVIERGGWARLCVFGRARDFRHRAASAAGVGLGPGVRALACGLSDRGAEGLELHHLYRAMMWLGAGRRGCQSERRDASAAADQGRDRRAAVRAALSGCAISLPRG